MYVIWSQSPNRFIYLFGVLHRFQHCRGSWKGRWNQYIQLVKVLHCKLLTNGKQLPVFPLEVGPGTETQSQRWEARVLPLCHCVPSIQTEVVYFYYKTTRNVLLNTFNLWFVLKFVFKIIALNHIQRIK